MGGVPVDVHLAVVRGDAQVLVARLTVVGPVAVRVVGHQVPELFALRHEPVDVRLLAGGLRLVGAGEREVHLTLFDVGLLAVGRRARARQAHLVLGGAAVERAQIVVALPAVGGVPARRLARDEPERQRVDVVLAFEQPLAALGAAVVLSVIEARPI
jgi:hypothetical protein